MERVASDEDKIRRAIEISQKRNSNRNYGYTTTRVNVNNKKDYKLFRKMILQIIICLLIYFIFYLITTTNYAFSDQVIERTNSILNYDINLQEIYNNCQNYIQSIINNEEKNSENNENHGNTEIINNSINQTIIENIDTNNTIHNVVNEEKNEIQNSIDDENKSDENAEIKDEKVSKEKTQMEKDAETVKKLCSFKKPLNGTVTSEFGEREVTSKVMSADHKGIDIAAKTGTNIKSAISGTVTVAEQNSEYGKFVKITNGDVMTVYAHCNKLKVKKGDKVKIGQTIAQVGSTGNSTGPHLHFEIRLSGRFINPRYVIKF